MAKEYSKTENASEAVELMTVVTPNNDGKHHAEAGILFLKHDSM